MVTYEEYIKAVDTANEFINQLHEESCNIETTIAEAVKNCSNSTIELVDILTCKNKTGIRRFFMTYPKNVIYLMHIGTRRAVKELEIIANANNINW